jgi:hypothetical protein
VHLAQSVFLSQKFTFKIILKEKVKGKKKEITLLAICRFFLIKTFSPLVAVQNVCHIGSEAMQLVM